MSEHPVDVFFNPDGELSKFFPNYEPRPQQVEMAQAVYDAIQRESRAVIEAATGTGKTLAYLIPAILSGKRVIVSTATKALQEQIFAKDIPFLKKLFRSSFKHRRAFRAVYLKGRSNYLCKLRFEVGASQIRFHSRGDAVLFSRIRKWAKITTTGDRSEIEGLPSDYAPWQEITASTQQCHGKACTHFHDCFVTRIRREAREADVIVVNHHLYFADLSLRDNEHAEILPEHDVVVFDEAHHLENTITSFFGTKVSSYRISELIRDIRRGLEDEDALTRSGREHLDEVEYTAHLFFECFLNVQGRVSLKEVMDDELQARVDKMFGELAEELVELGEWVSTADAGEIVERLSERCIELRDELAFVLGMDHPDMVYMVERRGNGVFLEAAPLDVAELFRQRVLSQKVAQVFTSATLAANGDFGFYMSRLGMNPKRTKTLQLEPVFDYQRKALMYVPKRLPAPNHPDYIDGVCTIVKYLVGITEGRAFVLFTSYKNLTEVHERLSGELDYEILKQGDAPNQEILARFRENVSSVLFATHSFWEGVDVEGEALSLVIIDKLPFASPGDPLTKARMDHLDASGGNAFRDFSMPSAAIALRQGFGRLIRSRRDFGIVALLDSRICSKFYGKFFLNSLPPAPVVWNARHAKQWWEAAEIWRATQEE